MAATGIGPTATRPARHVWVLRLASTAVLALLAVAAVRALVAGSAASGELRDWLAAVAFTVIGGRIAYRRPANPVGWLLFAVGATAAAAVFATVYRDVAAALTWLAAWLWWPAYGLLPVALLLFPDGHLPSGRWRWAAVVAGVGAVVPTTGLALGALVAPPEFLASGAAEPAARPYLLAAAAGMVSAAVAGAAGVVCMGLRWRSGRHRDRRQLALPLAAAAAVVVGGVLESLGVPGVWVIGGAAIPLAVAVAIVRHGLYDLGGIVSRTIAYATLTAVLAGLYAAVVLTLTYALAPAVRGVLPEAVAALTIAVVFQPLRRAVQQRVDRRFNRARYDARLQVERFAARLRAEVELDTLTADLLGVVDRTVQPARRALLLRGPAAAPSRRPAGD